MIGGMIRLCCNDNNLELIAGDDYTFAVDFMLDDEPYTIQAGDTVELLLHGHGEDKTIKAHSYDNCTAIFYLSSDETLDLLNNGQGCVYKYCIRIKWANGGQSTPIFRQTLSVLRC